MFLVPTTPLLAGYNQLGPKLVGTGGFYGQLQGESVALSADGSTLVVRGPLSSYVYVEGGGGSGLWVFQRNATGFAQVDKLVLDASDVYACSLALSADGSTLAVGGYENGAVRIFRRDHRAKCIG